MRAGWKGQSRLSAGLERGSAMGICGVERGLGRVNAGLERGLGQGICRVERARVG